MITENYKNALTEVYKILQYVDEEQYNLIPKDVIEAIEKNRNLDYEYTINEDVNIYAQPMLPETKAILFNFYRDYWASNAQKQKILNIQKRERYLEELKKAKKYSVENMFKNKKNT